MWTLLSIQITATTDTDVENGHVDLGWRKGESGMNC